MRISKLPLSESNSFLEFVRETNPKRVKAEERFNWQMTENPHLPDKESPPIYISTDNDNNIVGHFLIVPFRWYFNSETYDGFWGVDYYVKEEHRGAAGALLAMKAIRGNRPYFTIDPSEAAQKIAFTLGVKEIGCLQKSIWFRTSLSRLKLTINNFIVKSFLKRPIPFHITSTGKNNFPTHLSNRVRWQFQLCDNIEKWVDYQWPDTLGFTRSTAFINWRFFKCYKKYYLYRLKGSDKVYFVVRTANWKGIKVLVLVDYRLPNDDEKSWEAIVEASKKLAELNRYDGVITMHSHSFFEPGLKKNSFQFDDIPYLIVSNAKIKLQTASIEKSNNLFSTMADCDIDINFGK